MIKINKNKAQSFLLYLVLMIPTIIAYLFIFIASMNYSKDRHNYLSMMDVNDVQRVEPLILFIARFLNFFIEGNYVCKLIITQLFFFLVFLTALYKYFNPDNLDRLTKCLLALMLLLLVNAVVFGVQLRMGYATFIFIYLIVSLKRFDIKYFILFILPVLMHFGTLLPILMYFYIYIFNVNNRKNFIKHTLILFIPFTMVILNIDQIFNLLGVSNYYYVYINGEALEQRALPYTVLFYILNACYLIAFHRSMPKDKYYWLSLSGLWLVYIGLALKFILAFKMLIPIMMISVMYTAKHLPSQKTNAIIYLIFAYIFSIIGFSYLAFTTNLKYQFF